MKKELAFVLINPHTIAKSRTGGIISRYIGRTDLSLVAARMYGPSMDLAGRYSELLRNSSSMDPKLRRLLADYVLAAYAPDQATGKRRRVMLLLFEGENAVEKIWKVTGSATLRWGSGETIRDTYGDYVLDAKGEVKYFEPAVLVAPSKKRATQTLRLWSRFSSRDGGIIESAVDVDSNDKTQKTLVLLKPDNFKLQSIKPGNLIDVLSMSGLRIVGAKKFSMTVAQAESFYGPVRKALQNKFTSIGSRRVSKALSGEFGFNIPEECIASICEKLGPMFADQQFASIVRFMTGYLPSECSEKEKESMGKESCLAFVYKGHNAVNKIREIVGETDPSKARPGSVRREFGSNVMVNAAHASDSPENAMREMSIIKINDDDILNRVNKYYGSPIEKVIEMERSAAKKRTKIMMGVRHRWQREKN